MMRGVREKTTIEAAAVRIGDRIFTGRRHTLIARSAIFETGVADIDAQDFGFVTSSGDFVSRKQAALIALAAGQISVPTPELHSQDLWPESERNGTSEDARHSIVDARGRRRVAGDFAGAKS